jgi:hypothetical protein
VLGTLLAEIKLLNILSLNFFKGIKNAIDEQGGKDEKNK